MERSHAALPPSLRVAKDGRSFRLDPRDPVFYGDPYPAYAELHRVAPVAWWEEAKCLAVVSHEVVSRLLKDREFGRVLSPDGTGRPNRESVPAHLRHFYALEEHSLLDLEAPAHTRLRSRLTRSFVSRRIETLAPAIGQLVQELIDGFAGAGRVELVSALAEPLPVAIIADLIGVPRADAPRLLAWSHAMVGMYGFGRDRAVEERADAAAREFRDYLRERFAAKRAQAGDDLLSGLLAEDAAQEPLSEAELLSLVVLLLNAGHEATVHQIGNGVRALIASGWDGRREAEDEAAAERLVEECLRFDTPLHLFKRVALKEADIGGHTVKRGDEIALLLGAANHDPAVFAEPEKFNPNRPRNPHVSFGAGAHFCIGAPLARLELRIVFQALLQRLPRLRLNGPVQYRDTYHFRGVERLQVAWDIQQLAISI